MAAVDTKSYDFLQFLGHEEQNLLTSFVLHRRDFDAFTRLDVLWKTGAATIDVPNKLKAIPRLYLFCHFHLYISLAALMRAHLSESFASTRKAIDASLSAYEMILNEESVPLYEKGDNRFKFIKRHITAARQKDKESYPLAEPLIELHELCSELGAHADNDAFIYRTETVVTERKDKERFLFHYFQFPKDRDEYHFFYVDLLLAYARMLNVFRPVVLKMSKELPGDWESEVNKFLAAAEKEWESTRLRIRESPERGAAADASPS